MSHHIAQLDKMEVEGSLRVIEEPDEGTLDEPVLDTIKRDLRAIGTKFSNVLLPGRNKSLLHDWDLWGPLVLCIVMSVLLQQGSSNKDGDGGIRFVEAFVVLWSGAGLVTINTQLLKGKVSFFQCVCTLGYCLAPLCIALIFMKLLPTNMGGRTATNIIRLVFCGTALAWSVWAVLGFLKDYLPSDRKGLAVYPIFLFYCVVTALILAQAPKESNV